VPTTPKKPWDTNITGRFAASFSARRYTADRRGYRNYLHDHAPDNIRQFIRKRLPVCLPEKARTLNSYIFASPGAGKSELLKLIVHSDLRKPSASAVVAIDVANDFAEQLRFREFAEDDSRLVYIDPYLEYGFTPTINPFTITGPFLNLHHEQHVKDRVAAQVYDVLKQLLSEEEGGGFTATMKPILRYGVRALLDIPNATFERLEDLLLRDAELMEQCQHSTSERAAKFFSETFPSDNTKRSCDSLVARLQATVLATDTFRDLTCGPPTVSLERLIDERKVIVFNLAKGETTTEVALTFGRLVLALITAIGLRRARTPEEKRTPTHVIIDEFQNFVTDSVFTTIEELRKFRVMQTFAQPNLFARMSQDQRHSFMNGVQGAQFYGKCNAKTAEYIASFTGIDAEELTELGQDDSRRGEFFVWTQGRPPFLLIGDGRLRRNQHSMTVAEWEPVKRRQLARYYRQVEDREPDEAEPAAQAHHAETVRPAASSPEPPPRPHVAPSSGAASTGTTKRKPTSKMRPPRKPPPPEPA
jgi:hypothetical protein